MDPYCMELILQFSNSCVFYTNYDSELFHIQIALCTGALIITIKESRAILNLVSIFPKFLEEKCKKFLFDFGPFSQTQNLKCFLISIQWPALLELHLNIMILERKSYQTI